MSQADRNTLLNQARGLMNAGRLHDAERIGQSLVEGGGNDIEALMLMGSIAMQRGSLDRAEALSQRCAKLEPGAARHHVNIGKVRVMAGQLESAAAAFDRALKVTPNFAPALAAKAEVLNLLGRVDEARSVLVPLVAEKKETADVGLIYATVVQQAGNHTQAIELASRHLENPGVVGPLQVKLGLVLGKSYEAIGEYDKAFGAYQRANQIRGASAQFDHGKYVSKVDHLIDFFSAGHLRQLARSTCESALPIFIAGMPRSGTSLVEQIISSHPQAYGAGELVTLEQVIRTCTAKASATKPAAFPDWLETASPATLDEMSEAYLRELGRLAKRATRAVDKYLRHVEYVGLISMLFPAARVIHCRRDPLDCCISCYTSALSPIMQPYCTDLRHLGLHYRQYDRLMTHWRSELSYPILDVQYEELVANQESISRRIIEFCGLDWNDRCLQFHETKRSVITLSFDQVRRPIYDKSIGRGQRFEKHLGPLIEALAGR